MTYYFLAKVICFIRPTNYFT